MLSIEKPMSQEISSTSILAARSELIEFTLESANDFFSSTWQASHIRLVELVPDEVEIRFPVLLAHVLTRNPAGGYPLEEWLPNTSIQKIEKQSLREALEGALEDLQEADDRPNELLADALARLSIQDAESCYTILADDSNLPRPRSAYKYGPTYQYFWLKGNRFYYLEIHHES
jgi:hypothetical protein